VEELSTLQEEGEKVNTMRASGKQSMREMMAIEQ